MKRSPTPRDIAILLAAVGVVLAFLTWMWLTIGCRSEKVAAVLHVRPEIFGDCIANSETHVARTVVSAVIVCGALLLGLADWLLFERGRKPSERAGLAVAGLNRRQFRALGVTLMAGISIVAGFALGMFA